MPFSDPEKQREYQRRWVARRRSEFFADKSCALCGARQDLQLDHVDPDLKVSHSVWSWSAVRRNEELAKCQPLCVSCHWRKTAAERDIRVAWEHGTLAGYMNHRCRCTPCREAKSFYRSQRSTAGMGRSA